MLLIFIRHGKAEPKTDGKPDKERELTEEGKADIEALAKILPTEPRKIFTSPYKRAIQTAEIIGKIWGVSIEVKEELSPENMSIEALKKIEISGGEIFVGHAPSIEVVVSKLIGGGNIHMSSGSAAIIEIEEIKESKGHLLALISRDVVRKIMDMYISS